MKKKKILHVEDDEGPKEFLSFKLGKQAVILFASSIEEARKVISQNPDINIAVLDGSVPEDDQTGAIKAPNTDVLIEALKALGATVIAASADPDSNMKMKQMGADIICSDKTRIAQLLVEEGLL